MKLRPTTPMKKVPMTPGKPNPFDVTISDMASQRNQSRHLQPVVNEEDLNWNLPSELKYWPKIAWTPQNGQRPH